MKIKKILCLCLSLVLCASFMISCSNSKPENEGENVLTFTEEYLVRDGHTDYKIVIPSQATNNESLAAETVAKYLEMATGTSFDIVFDNVVSSNTKIISVGETTFLSQTSKKLSRSLHGYSGFEIFTENNNLYLIGDGYYGTLYAGYELLSGLINWDIFYVDEIVYDTNVKELFVPNYNLLDIPDYDLRVPSTDIYVYDQNLSSSQMMRFNLVNDLFIEVGQVNPHKYSHNTFNILPPEKYNNPDNPENYHPKWYTSDGVQLSFVAGGDPDEYQAMVKEMGEVYYDGVIKSEEPAFLATLSNNDTTQWDTCQAAKDLLDEYGSHSASAIILAKDIYAYVKNKMQENGVERDFLINVSAYFSTEDPPKKVDERVKCGKEYGVVIAFTPIYMDYRQSIVDEDNADQLAMLEGWTKVTTDILFRTYNAHFDNTLVPYTDYNAISETYAAALNYSCGMYAFSEGAKSIANPGFDILKAYLYSKVLWDTEVDINALIDNFFENYFKDAKEPMRRFFDSLRSWNAYRLNELPPNMSQGVTTLSDYKKESWPIGLLLQWETCINEAYSSIEHLKSSDLQTYLKLYDRICLESLSVRFMLIDLYGKDYMAEPALTIAKKQFRIDAIDLGCTVIDNHNTMIDTICDTWGI